MSAAHNNPNEAHILIVDDEASIRVPLCQHLNEHDFHTSATPDAKQARALLKSQKFDLIVLDIMMPGEDGLSLCKHVSQTCRTPIILLTALAEDEDRIKGLEIGADDYLTKPFNPRELLARIRSVLRRTTAKPPKALPKIVKFSDWTLDTVHGELSGRDGVIETISTGELALLKVLLDNPGKTLSRDELLSQTKGRAAFPFERSIDIMISRLRHKIEADAASPQLIKTIWGGGYQFTGDVETP